MIAISDWLPPACVGSTFTLLGLLKVHGLVNGTRGGACKPFGQRVCGSCPGWSRGTIIGATLLFLVIGLTNLAWLALLLNVGGAST